MILLYFVCGMLLFFIPFSILQLLRIVNLFLSLDSRLDSVITYIHEVSKKDEVD